MKTIFRNLFGSIYLVVKETIFKRYAVFKGRSTRTEFFLFWAFTTAVWISLALNASYEEDLSTFPTPEEWAAFDKSPSMVVLYIYSLIVLLPSLALIVRRLHDTGRSGYWFLRYLVIKFLGSCIPFLTLLWGFGSTIIFLFILMTFQGDEGENKYGPNPRNGSFYEHLQKYFP